MSVVSEGLAAAPDEIDRAALAETMPHAEIDVSRPSLNRQDVRQPYFRRWGGWPNGKNCETARFSST
jgi:hypothetical protein